MCGTLQDAGAIKCNQVKNNRVIGSICWENGLHHSCCYSFVLLKKLDHIIRSGARLH